MQKKRLESFILWYDAIDMKDISLVGGKNASLGEMCQNLKTKIPIPPGFAITSYAYRYFLEKGGVLENLKKTLDGLDVHDQKKINPSW